MSLELKRKQVELLRIQASRAELEMKVIEREEEIAKIRSTMDLQLAREDALKVEIEQLTSKGV
jgi:hypothetical protein